MRTGPCSGWSQWVADASASIHSLRILDVIVTIAIVYDRLVKFDSIYLLVSCEAEHRQDRPFQGSRCTKPVLPLFAILLRYKTPVSDRVCSVACNWEALAKIAGFDEWNFAIVVFGMFCWLVCCPVVILPTSAERCKYPVGRKLAHSSPSTSASPNSTRIPRNSSNTRRQLDHRLLGQDGPLRQGQAVAHALVLEPTDVQAVAPLGDPLPRGTSENAPVRPCPPAGPGWPGGPRGRPRRRPRRRQSGAGQHGCACQRPACWPAGRRPTLPSCCPSPSYPG